MSVPHIDTSGARTSGLLLLRVLVSYSSIICCLLYVCILFVVTREEIFPRLMTFQPDIIFISAGFDAHKKDTINGGYIALVSDELLSCSLIFIYFTHFS